MEIWIQYSGLCIVEFSAVFTWCAIHFLLVSKKVSTLIERAMNMSLQPNKCVFSNRRNSRSDSSQSPRWSGRLFYRRAPAAVKERSPKVVRVLVLFFCLCFCCSVASVDGHCTLLSEEDHYNRRMMILRRKRRPIDLPPVCDFGNILELQKLW